MDYVLLFLAVIIWIHAETYDGSRPCKMDLGKSPHVVSRADPRTTVFQGAPDVAAARKQVRGTQCADKAIEACDDGRASKPGA